MVSPPTSRVNDRDERRISFRVVLKSLKLNKCIFLDNSAMY